MIRRAALVAAGLLLALAACDRGRPPAGFASPAAPALFEIAGPGGAVEGWLFGTIHSLPGGVSWETETLADALAAADVLVVEVRDLEDGAALRRAFERRAYSAPRPPLAERVPPSLRPRLESLMAEGSMPAGALDRMETWAAALTLAQLGQTGKAENGVDRALVRRMGAGAVIELEGAGAQLDIFDRLPEREQRDLLAAVIADLADRQAGSQGNAARWYRGDIGQLADPATSAILADPELRDALYAGRNRDWAGRLAAMLDEAPRPFVAVGAAHLAGEDGLPALLHRRGYTVRRIQ